MSRVDNSHHLLRAAAARHDVSVERTRAVLQELDRTGQAVTVSAVARAAAVSRSWIYSQPELRDTITRLRVTSAAALRSALPAVQRASSESLRQRLDATRTEMSQLRLARSLGDSREGR
ncbi:MAG: DUF6262 family protein [Acidimicrobiales bacterium]